MTNNDYDDGLAYWSPDRDEIVFFSDRDGDDEIYIMNSDGTNIRQLTNNDFMDRAPSWSPNGKFIAFVSNRDGNQEIYIMKTDGTNVSRVTKNTNRDFWPSWSPDSKILTFTSFFETQDTYYVSIEEIFNGKITKPKLLMKNCSRCEFSHDGTKIAYSSKLNSSYVICISDISGENIRQITSKKYNHWVPTWSNNDRFLIYSKEEGYYCASIIRYDLYNNKTKKIIYPESQNWRPLFK